MIITTSAMTAQDTAADYKRAETFLRPNVEKRIYRTQVIPHWINDTPRFWYKVNTRQGKQFILVDTRKKQRKQAFDHEKLAKALSTLLGKTFQGDKLPFDSITFTGKGQNITFTVDKKTIAYSPKTGTCKGVEQTQKDAFVSTSPDGKWEALVTDYNLYIRSTVTNEKIQLTRDGSRMRPYGLDWDWYAMENESLPDKKEKKQSIHIVWSPDSTKLVTQRLDYRTSKKLYLFQASPKEGYRAQVWSYFRPLPGEPEGLMVNYYLFDVTQRKKTAVDIPALHCTTTWHFPTWFKDSRRLFCYYYERGYKKVILKEIDASTGAARTVLEESSATFIDTAKLFIHILEKGSQFVWGSQKDGWSHLYLHDWKTGNPIRQITTGEFVVRRLVHVDEKKRQVYFTASGREKDRDPYLLHFYRASLDGGDPTLLTGEKAQHWIRLSPDKRYIVDTYSLVNTPPKSVLRRLRDGKIVLRLETGDVKDLLDAGWTYPQPFKAKARDGKTDIYGVMFRPSNFDPAKKYPVIDSTYSGPHAVRTPKSFRRGCLNSDQAIAELGFIVITVDGLGTANRGKKFHDFSYRNLGDIGAPDHMAAIGQLAKKYPFVDDSRVGIFGHSAGGYDAARALLKHPDFYHVAVSSAGNHDHRMAKAWWPEHYQGYPVGDYYGEQSNLSLAKNLKGKLLLVHGDMDNNVNPACTLRLAAELVKADKDFDLLLIPNRSHSLRGHPHFIRKRWDYFVRHLLKKEPPEYHITTGSK